ncbi:MAG: hypothetical protein GTO14_24925 [Anaerolineales bacterium]|nr:hypothetical protein [Anaerolineales bacterium]
MKKIGIALTLSLIATMLLIPNTLTISSAYDVKKVKVIPAPVQFWREFIGGVTDIIVSDPPDWPEGVALVRDYVVLHEGEDPIPLEALTWPGTEELPWERIDIEPYILEPGETAEYDIPTVETDAAVLVRYTVAWASTPDVIEAHFVNEAILESSSPQVIVGQLTNFDVHNDYHEAVDNFELELYGIQPSDVEAWFPGWGAPPQINAIPGGTEIIWLDPTQPIPPCHWEHFGLHLKPGVIATGVKAYWTQLQRTLDKRVYVDLLKNGDFSSGLDCWNIRVEKGHEVRMYDGPTWLATRPLGSGWTDVNVIHEPGRTSVLDIVQTVSDGDGDWTGAIQKVNRDVSGFSELYFEADGKAIFQSLAGDGWVGGEYPVHFIITYQDINGVDHDAFLGWPPNPAWQQGFYYLAGNLPNEPYSNQVAQNTWFHYKSPNLMTLSPAPKIVKTVRLYSSGWAYHGRMDNAQLYGTLPSAELGDIIHVELEVTVPSGETATVVDTLPSELSYIAGTFTVNGVSATPTITKTSPPPPIITELSYTVTTPGIHLIAFDCKVDNAYWEDREVCNVATATWYDAAGVAIETKEDIECFTIHAFWQLHKNVGIPKADVIFAIDLTGSMWDEIATVKAQATNIMNSLAAQIADVQFGLISYMDYNGTYSTTAPGSVPLTYTALYGSTASGDYPYNLDQDITNNIPLMTAKINGLTIGWGADGPQDYTRIIHESWNDPNLHWRTGAKRILILFGDNVPHDTNFDYDNDGTLENTGGDPGRDTILGTTDDLDFETEVANAATNGVHIMAVYSGSLGARFPWTYMADETGGEYFELTEAEQIPDAIKELIKRQAEETLTIKEQTEVQWAVVMDVVNPFSYTMKNVSIKDNFGAELKVDEVITPPDTNHDGIVNIHDLSRVASDYGTRALIEPDQWDPATDMNLDGVVDIRDLAVVSRNFGLTLWLTGKTDKVHLFWYIGDLLPGETARIIILVSTDLNPAGQQEYTEPGVYEMNSGATLKFTDPLQDTQLSAMTGSIYVTVLPAEDP